MQELTQIQSGANIQGGEEQCQWGNSRCYGETSFFINYHGKTNQQDQGLFAHNVAKGRVVCEDYVQQGCGEV